MHDEEHTMEEMAWGEHWAATIQKSINLSIFCYQKKENELY